MKEEEIKLLERLKHLCSRREYCRADIVKKAASALDGDMEAAMRLADILVEEKYVDDLRYASAYARDKAGLSGWGEVKIRYMLAAKGIDREVISQALSDIDHDKAHSRLEKLLENKLRTLRDDPQCRLRLLRFGLGRGYGYDEVSSVVEGLLKDMKD